MKTQVIDVTEHSPRPAQELFALLVDEMSWPEWSPLGSAELQAPGEPDPHGIGAIRRFKTGRSVSIERVVECEAPRRFSYELVSGLPLEGYRAVVELTPRDGGTDIHWRSTFQGKFPLTGGFYRVVLGRFIARLVRGLAQSSADVTA
jgi:hypothetical protein